MGRTAPFPVTADEPERLRVLDDYGILTAPAPPDLGSIVELAAFTCQVPHAVVNILSAEEQHQIAALGFDKGVCARGESMCAVSIVEPVPVIVPDARLDPRFARNPWVSGVLGNIRFYAASQLRTPEGQVLGTLCIFDDEPRELAPPQRGALDKLADLVVDILQLHRHERLLREALVRTEEARAELERSNRALGHFAGQVSHDLKNPLTGILGHATNLIEIPAVNGDEQAAFCADRVVRSATRMHRTIEDVLALAGTGGRINPQAVDLDAVAHAVVEDLGSMVRAQRARVTVEALPTVQADPTQLRLLLQNLVGNAVKYRAPERPPVVTLTAEHHPDRWDIKVVDNGRGIPARDRERVMEAFTRLHTDVEGSGIGLATCRGIASAHGGELRIQDTPGGGTTVVFRLPRTVPALDRRQPGTVSSRR